MKRLLALILALCFLLICSAAAGAAAPEDFSDFPSDWSAPALSAALDNGLLQGDNGLIAPQGKLTRAQMAAILIRAMGGENAADISGFSDVDSGAWYYQSLAVAVKMGLFQGDGALLSPNANITREQAALVLSRMFRLSGAEAGLSAFSDRDSVSAWAYQGLAAMVEAGYMQGSNGRLNPLGSITRAEFAQIMYNMIDEYLAAPGSYSPATEGSLVLRAAGTSLNRAKISGDLIIGYGVSDGDVYLNDCTVKGRLVVRGGGVNSIYISGGAYGELLLCRPDGQTRVVLDGEVSVERLIVDAEAKPVIIDVKKGSTITELVINAPDVTVAGEGRVTRVVIGKGASDVTVDIPGAIIVNNSDEPVQTAKGTVLPGETATTNAQGGVSTDGGGSETRYYRLTLSLVDDQGHGPVTAATTSRYLSGSTSFCGEVFALLNANLHELGEVFDDSAARDLVYEGLEVYQEDDAAWAAYIRANFASVAGAEEFEDRDITLSQVRGETVMSFSTAAAEYTLTVNVALR